jgi:hypothetical protein
MELQLERQSTALGEVSAPQWEYGFKVGSHAGHEARTVPFTGLFLFDRSVPWYY